MLTKLKNYSSDEYSTTDDNGSLVPPMACSFAKTYQNGNIFSVVDEDGYIVLYDVSKTGPSAVKKTWQAHANAVFDLKWTADDQQILTASGDQTVALWEVENNKRIEVFKGHTSSVKSVSSRCGDEAVFASGSRDGHIMIWDKRIFHKGGAIPPVDTIYNGHALLQNNTPGKARKKKPSTLQPKDGQQSVTSVLFQDNNYLISCGAVDGCIKMWDIRKTYKLFTSEAVPVQTFQYPGSSLRKHGFSCLTLDDSKSRLFASCTDDIIYEYNVKSNDDRPVHYFRGHKNSTFYVKTALSPDNQFLLSGSSDNHAYIWQINKREAPPIVLKAHDAEVTSVAWCPIDLTKVVTLSDDSKTKFWCIYCREQKSGLLPPWLGRARRFSRERSTSTAGTPILNRHLKPNASTPSPRQSPHNSKTPLTPSATTPSGSVRDWLKRKITKDVDSCDGPSATKRLPDKSECYSSAAEASLNTRKRPFSNLSSSKNQFSQIEKCDQPKSLGTPQSDIDFNCSSPSKRSKVSIDNTNSSSSMCVTPRRVRNNENLIYTSPRKLFKRELELKDSPTKSPKRLCLTPVKDNGQSENEDQLSSVKFALFENKQVNGGHFPSETLDNKISSNSSSMKPVDNNDDTNSIPHKSLQLSDDKEVSNNSSHSESSLTPINTPLKQKLQLCMTKEEDHNSPTRNLPNLVIDQMTNLRPTSPLLSKSSQKKVDWLTRMKMDKNKKGNDNSDKISLSSVSVGITKSSSKISKSVKMRTIQTYFKAQNSE